MKRLFYFGICALALFEFANVYFIMPLPFSQTMVTIDVAYFLYSWRWVARVAFGGAAVVGLPFAWRAQGRMKWLVPASLSLAALVVYAANFRMSAEHMFREPAAVIMQPATRNAVEAGRLVVGIEIKGDARAYPVRFIAYHHKVRDTVGGTPVLVSYCNVCRTGRVFSPLIDGRLETFRLVGMDHFNAMFEDRTTGSWWRQANGEALVGPMKGTVLAEVPSQQLTLTRWLLLHPKSLIMQPDARLQDKYAKGFDYETGASRKELTGTDTISWHDKAWVVGLEMNGESKAYDWNRLRRERVINDAVGGTPIVLVLARDTASFFAFERPDASTRFALRGDSLIALDQTYALSGQGAGGALKLLFASQEFWHSWRTFHPRTKTY